MLHPLNLQHMQYATTSKPIVDKCNMLQPLNTFTMGRCNVLQPLQKYIVDKCNMIQPLNLAINQINGNNIIVRQLSCI
jgi:hypothetical protein